MGNWTRAQLAGALAAGILDIGSLNHEDALLAVKLMDEQLETLSDMFDINPGVDRYVKAKMYSETTKQIQAFLNCSYPDVVYQIRKIAIKHKNQIERHLS